MKNRRAVVLLLLTVVLSILLACIGLTDVFSKKKQKIELRSSSVNELCIYPFIKEDEMYFFIPSGLKTDDLFLLSDKKIYHNEKIINNRPLSEYVDEEEHVFTFEGKNYVTYFLLSEGVPALFIDTLKMDMDYINNNKGNIVDIRAFLLGSEGEIGSVDSKGTIKGRGNNSWDTEKKAYNLNFEDPINLLGMKEARRWAMIPNSTDITDINNKVVFEFARQTGLTWTPESRFVNVYLDGSYNGLYLISEKVEIDANRLDLDDNGVLFKRELNERLEKVNNGFLTKNGNVIEITSPKKVSSFYKEEIEDGVQSMEDAIFDLTSDEWKEKIDVDSWARCYLIDELFDNLDAGIASANFYRKEDGKYYRGPVWDYDSIMMDVPRSMIADTYQRQPYSTNDYYYYLNQRTEFKERVRQIFESEFLPIIDDFISQKIDAISNEIAVARTLDEARWSYRFSQAKVYTFKNYLLKKSQFMQEYWADEDRYCKILVQSEIFYRTFMVEKGSAAKEALDLDLSLFEDKIYRYEGNGEEFDLDDIVESDIILVLDEDKEVISTEKTWIASFGVLNVFFLSFFVCMFIYIIFKGIKRNA